MHAAIPHGHKVPLFYPSILYYFLISTHDSSLSATSVKLNPVVTSHDALYYIPADGQWWDNTLTGCATTNLCVDERLAFVHLNLTQMGLGLKEILLYSQDACPITSEGPYAKTAITIKLHIFLYAFSKYAPHYTFCVILSVNWHILYE